MPLLAVYTTADGRVSHLVADLADLPPLHAGEAVVPVPDDAPQSGTLHVTVDPETGLGTITSTTDAPAPVVARRLTVQQWMLRFSLEEQLAYRLARMGYAADGATPLTVMQQGLVGMVEDLMRAGSTVDPAHPATGAALGILAQLGIIAPSSILAKQGPVTDAELADMAAAGA